MTLTWPVAAPRTITRDFYFKDPIYVGGQHAADDVIPVGRSSTGEPLLAAADGLVVENGYDASSGWHISIDVEDGWRCGYRHLREQSWLPVGTTVQRGDGLGYMDSTGNVTGPHLHFDLWNKRKLSPEAFYKVGWYAHDPLKWLQEGDWFDMATQADLEAVVAKQRGFRLFQDPRTGVITLVQAGRRRPIDSLVEFYASGYSNDMVESLPIPGISLDDFDQIPYAQSGVLAGLSRTLKRPQPLTLKKK